MLSGNNPLPEPILAKIFDAIIGVNKLNWQNMPSKPT